MSNLSKFIISIFVFTVAWGIITVGFPALKKRLLPELEEERTKWNKHGISSYHSWRKEIVNETIKDTQKDTTGQEPDSIEKLKEENLILKKLILGTSAIAATSTSSSFEPEVDKFLFTTFTEIAKDVKEADPNSGTFLITNELIRSPDALGASKPKVINGVWQRPEK